MTEILRKCLKAEESWYHKNISLFEINLEESLKVMKKGLEYLENSKRSPQESWRIWENPKNYDFFEKKLKPLRNQKFLKIIQVSFLS